MLADVFAPQHNKRLPKGTAHLSKRVPLIAADKKKVNKASIGLPLPRTFKLFTYNCNPFILEYSLPVEDFHKKNLDQHVNIRTNAGFNTTSEAPRAPLHSTPAAQQHTSLGGSTLYSIANQDTFATPRDLRPDPSQNLQKRQTSNKYARPVISNSRLNKINPKLIAKVYTWLANVSAPADTEPEYSNFVSNIVIDEEGWDLIERSARQRKSRLRQIPNTMSIEINQNSVRGGKNPRPSGSYSRTSETRTRTTMTTIKDHPGTTARRPKSMPSGSQLPSCWSDEMDEFICHMEAQCEFSTKSIVRALKQRFAELREVCVAFFSLRLWSCVLTLLQVCHPGRSDPASHRYP